MLEYRRDLRESKNYTLNMILHFAFERRFNMKRFLIFAISMLAVPLIAGEIHGKVTAKGLRDSSDAVVYIDKVPGKTFAPPSVHGRMNQKSLQFLPHVLPVVVGTTVDFLNSDSVLHNVFSPDACADRFNLGTWPQGQSKSFTFKKECFVALLCKVHPEMEGFVAVLPTSYFAVTSPNGSYEIKDVPDGTYTVKVWHPRLKPAQKSVVVKGATEVSFAIAK
jgi:plastocyanin